jgi:metallophosphoesterase (TIGR00282 family)
MKILTLGDVTGSEAVEYLSRRLRNFKRENKIDFTVVNGENSAKANGIDPASANALLDAGADAITTGNHVYRINAVYDYLDESSFVIRPANFPKGCAGVGYTILDCGFQRVLVMNVLGQTYMEPVGCPFEAVESILEKEKGNYNVSLLDVHAEATSEKAAIAMYFDGRISAVTGHGLFVKLDNTCEGLIPISEMPEEFRFDEKNVALVSKKRVYHLGEEIRVKLEECDLTRGKLRFSILPGRRENEK